MTSRTSLSLATATACVSLAWSVPAIAQTTAKKPNILVIFGDDVGPTNISAYSFGVVGYKTRASIALHARG